MPSSPLVSVTLMTYNHSRYVLEALESVLAQTYSPLEIIISDDASTDDTAAKISAALAAYRGPHSVRFLRHTKNLGGDGRNNFVEAYRQSKGEFVIWLCGDDAMMPTQVARMVDTWRTQDLSLVTVNAEYMDELSRPLGRIYRNPAATPITSLETLARDGANDCCFGAGMGFSRELIEQFGYSEDNPPPGMAPDVIFPFYAGLLKGCTMITEPLLRYRVHGDNTSLTRQHEAAADLHARLMVERRIWTGHVEIAKHMRSTLAHQEELDPIRYRATHSHLESLVQKQHTMMVRRLAEVDQRLAALERGIPSAEIKTQEEFKGQTIEFLRADDFAGAAQSCDAALGIYPDAAEFWYLLALTLSAGGQVEVAVPILEQAVQLAPENESYQAELTRLLTKMESGSIIPSTLIPEIKSSHPVENFSLGVPPPEQG